MSTQPPTKTATHTPGPWFVHQIPGLEAEGKMYPISANADPASALAYVGLEHQPNLANARLIAAAPDLYAALAEIYAYWTGEANDFIHLTEVARAALAKAQERL
jgi:hypothetical protein